VRSSAFPIRSATDPLKQCGWYATLTCNWRAPADLVRYDRPMIVRSPSLFWVSNWNGEELNAKLRNTLDRNVDMRCDQRCLVPLGAADTLVL